MESRIQLPFNSVLDGTYRIERVLGGGGFGITYAAEDMNLATIVALKEYYPAEFGDRDRAMSIRPKSERHKETFEWGRASFLEEARTLARFRHPSIVRVSRVFEAHSTAYMVMEFEQGQDFASWLKGLGRPPTQEELDRIAAPLLDALELMHGENFLHRDISPDNIIVRADGTPVLLDFGAARRAVAKVSRSLTGIVKAGYSPQEQYAADSRLQGPWSDLYALGGTLYLAVTGKRPEEATLRVADDRTRPAAAAARGRYRPDFLAAIDACLKVRHTDRPQSVAQLRAMMFGRPTTMPLGAAPATQKIAVPAPVPGKRRWMSIAAAALVIVGGAYGGFEYSRWLVGERNRLESETRRQADAAAAAKAAQEAAWAKALADAEAMRQQELLAAERRAAEERSRHQAELKRLQEERAREEAELKRLQEAARRKPEETERKGATNPIDPANRFGAIAYSPSTGVHGLSNDLGSQEEAEKAALNSCAQRARDCKVPLWFRNACGALAVGPNGFGTGWGVDQGVAESYALKSCAQYSKSCTVRRWVCTTR
ncbi:MAG TPA: DUF4189 domain-containing protein [Hyphomicrobiaceae bacterium]